MGITHRVVRALPTRALHWAWGNLELVIGLGAMLAFYLWTASTSGDPFDFGKNQSDYYNLLADAFLRGHLHLLVEPAKQLLALHNPFDPTANAPYRLHDASLYHGHYYLQWGPVPALMAFMPFRLLPLGDLPQSLAGALFAFVGLCFAVALLRALVRRYLPEAPRWMMALGYLALATGSAVPFVLRRVAVYEIALLSAYAFLMAGLYLLATGALDVPARPRRLALASLCLGLAAGCRPTMAFVAGLLVAVWWALRRRDPTNGRQLAVVVLGPAIACGVLLALYNVARFGSPLEFGNSYQLAGVDVRTLHAYRVADLAPSLWFFLVARAHVTAGFPFFHLPPPPSYPGTLPSGYQIEVTGGVLTNVPIALAALCAVVLRTPREHPLRLVTLGLGGLGMALVVLIGFSLFGTTMRYETDFATLLVLAGVLGWLAVALRARRRTVRRVATVVGASLVAWGALFGVAISFTGYYDGLRTGKPGAYRALQDVSTPLTTVLAMIRGHPLLVDVYAPDGMTDTDPGPGIANPSLAVGARPSTLTIVSNRDQPYVLTATIAPGAPADRRATLRVRLPRGQGTMTVKATGARAPIELALERGVNRLSLSTAGPLVAVQDVALAPPPAAAR